MRRIFLATLSLAMFLSSFGFAQAAGPKDVFGSGKLQHAAEEVYGPGAPSSLEGMIGTIINIVLSLLGAIFLALTVYAGYLWTTAAGDDKQVAKAKTILTQAIVGIIILMSAFAISRFVLSSAERLQSPAAPVAAPPG